jgi:YfiH family protein
MITYKSLNKYTEIAHFCTTREGGASVGNYASFNLSPFSGDDPVSFKANKIKLGEHLRIDYKRIIIPHQIHGTEIREINDTFFQLDADERKQYLYGVDALFTQVPEICICVTTADCVPLLFYDPIKNVIAVAHAGWRGTCAHIAEKTLLTLIEKYNCQPANIRVVIGPSISAEVYNVGKDVLEKFEAQGFKISEISMHRNNEYYLDLWRANQQLLLETGVQKEQIEIAGICTYIEHERFFSARRLGIQSGRMLSGIMLKNGK